MKAARSQVIWAVLRPRGRRAGRRGWLAVTGLALRTANGLVAFLEVEVGPEVLLHKLQAVQVFLSPEDLKGHQNHQNRWEHVRTVNVKKHERGKRLLLKQRKQWHTLTAAAQKHDVSNIFPKQEKKSGLPSSSPLQILSLHNTSVHPSRLPAAFPFPKLHQRGTAWGLAPQPGISDSRSLHTWSCLLVCPPLFTSQGWVMTTL